MLGFRSLLRTHDTPDLLDITQLQLAAWLKHKRYDSSLCLRPEPVEIGRGLRASMQHHTDEAGSHTMRARTVEDTPSGTSTRELTCTTRPPATAGGKPFQDRSIGDDPSADALLDATARTQMIYVGYIGPHLPLSTS